VKELFKKDIRREINGVIKVGQQSEDTKEVELSEYVITKEVGGHLDQFYRQFVAAIDNPTDKTGVWISGFFGSGKSHYLKILSYLLGNKEVKGKESLAYFQPKVQDPMLFANMERASEVTGDVILFNIDSKADADSKSDKEAIVHVFMKVFNDHLGYFGTAPEIADFERRLDKDGNYEAFKRVYADLAGGTWQDERENWDFNQDTVVEALQQVLGMTQSAAQSLFNGLRNNYSLSVEKFARILKEYLDSKPATYRLIFMVDEVGQYIGENTDLMLNLQTLAEDLGTYCAGRAWIAVTSQEDIDSITQNRVKGNDFSKIQGRFKNRFSLTSANTDEVIKLRLLEKKPGATDSLEALYAQKEQILKNQIRFSNDTAEMPKYKDAKDFAESYPFVPYQFNLLQKVFTQVRLHGASGKHLSQGERSMLDAFQLALRQLESKPFGSLAPFYTFYEAIQGFLDSAISRVISQASEVLQPFELELLKTLFMVKYVKELKGTIENLTTLSLGHIDEDRLQLTEKVKGALNRLEKETLIQRNGDVYDFLTNEEQDVGKEIKAVSVSPDETLHELQKIIWEELYTVKKYRYGTRYDYAFSRKLDDLSYSGVGDLTLSIVTPYADDYKDLKAEHNALMRSGSGTTVLVRLPDDLAPFQELTNYVQTDKYVRQKNRDGLSSSLKTILVTRSEENQVRRGRAVTAFESLLARSDVFVAGQKLERLGSTAKDVLSGGLKALVETTYTKLGYIKRPFDTDKQIEDVLRAGNMQTTVEGEHPNLAAHQDVVNWLDEQQLRHQSVSLRMLNERFMGKPYGWTERDVQGVLVELLVQSLVELRQAQDTVDIKKLDIGKMTTKSGLDSYTVRAPRKVNPEVLRIARTLARDVLAVATIPDDPQDLLERYKTAFRTKQTQVRQNLPLAHKGYPFLAELQRHDELLTTLLTETSAASFFETLRDKQDDVEDMVSESSKIESFFKNQISLFDKTTDKLRSLENDLRHLSEHDLLNKVTDAKRILSLKDPTNEIPKLGLMLDPVEGRIKEIKEEKQKEAHMSWQVSLKGVTDFASEHGLNNTELAPLLEPLQELGNSINAAVSIDAVLARHGEVTPVKERVTSDLITRLNALSEAKKTPQAKPIKTFKPSTLATTTLLETEADVEGYTQRLKETLLSEVKAGNRIKIE
jgi:hypothetical protein